MSHVFRQALHSISEVSMSPTPSDAPIVVVVGNRHSPHPVTWERPYARLGAEVVFLNAHPQGSRLKRTLQLIRTFGPARPRIARLRQQGRRVVVHAHGAGTAGVLASLFVDSHPVVIVYGSEVIHAGDLPKTAQRAVAWVLRRAKRIVTTANSTWPAVIALDPTARARLTTVWLAPDWEKLAHGVTRTPGREIVFFSNRRLLPLYNISTLIEAFRTLPDPNLRLTLLRGDAAEGIAYVQNIKASIQGTGSVTLIDRFLSADELVTEYSRSDIAVSIAETDQLSFSIVEALATGCILVATDLEAYDAISHLDHVFTVPVPVTAEGVTLALQQALALHREADTDMTDARQKRSAASRAALEKLSSNLAEIL